MARHIKLKFNAETAEQRRPYTTMESLKALQVAVYVMCGGGFIGRFAAEQPADFYIDDRCGRLRYPHGDIYQAVGALVQEARLMGVDPHKMPEMVRFHNCGVF